MGQGMCASIRDVSNLSWKLAKCCLETNISDAVKETLLVSYQSERIPNVREYIETAIRLGALIESCDTEESLKQAFADKRESNKMKSIVPSLGAGLGVGCKDYQGIWFPQPMLSSGQRLDDRIGQSPVLLISAALLSEYLHQYAGRELDLAVISVEGE